MIVRIANPSIRYAVTTCFLHCLGSMLLTFSIAPRPSFSNAAQRSGFKLGTVSSIVIGAVLTGIGDKNADGGGATRCVGISGCGASGGTKIGGGGALCIGIGSDGAAAIALRASLPHDFAAGAL